MRDPMGEINRLVVENQQLTAKVMRLEIVLEEINDKHEPLRKAFFELLDETMTYRERMGLDSQHFEYDWLEKSGLL